MSSRPRLFLRALALILIAAAAPLKASRADQPIHERARKGTGEEVAGILKVSPALRDARAGLGMMPIHLAATNPDSGALKVLIAAGADVNAKDDEGTTPLHLAAFANKIEAAKLLLDAGADVNAKTAAGRTPLSMARKARADELAGLISLWILRGCKPGAHCEQATTNDLRRLVD